MAAIASGWLTLREPGAEPESIVPQRVTTGFFDVLRVRPAIGRTFTVANEVAGRNRVAVISDGLWRRRFGADPAIVGRTIPLEDVESGQRGYQVIGVMPPDFAYPVGVTRATEIWLPYVVSANQRIRDPHQHLVHETAALPGQQAEGNAHEAGQPDHQDTDEQRRSAAPEQAAGDVPPEEVRPQEGASAGRAQLLGHVDGDGIGR